ncbi:MAG: hypothetical protein ABFD90_19335 [Phycisphaerales bacterium]
MNEMMIPMVIVPLTFLFVLLIILITKAPKVGGWVVGGLLLLAPVLLWRFAATGVFAEDEAIPLFVVPITFLFVLLVVLLAKAPRIGVGLIVALVVMVVLGFFLAPAVSHHWAGYAPTGDVIHSQWKETVTEHGVDTVQVWEDRSVGSDVIGMRQESPTSPVPPVPVTTAPSEPLSPIWSEGVEQEFEADVYPSSLAAARALGRRMAEPIRNLAGDPNAAFKVVLFQEGNDRSLAAAFGREMESALPGVQPSVEADPRNVNPGEVGVTLRADGVQQAVELVEGQTVVISNVQESTRIVATAFTADRRTSDEVRFIDKPWVDNFGVFASTSPGRQFIVARSNGTCTSESEAHQQALDDARARLNEALGRHGDPGFAELPQSAISTMDVQNGGFVADRFMQSLQTSAGKVWRQAILVDVSAPKLVQLARVKFIESRQIRESWARMGLSVVGVLVLIGVIYFFLNMATRGYYEWSLRIAGVVLAVVAVVSILMIVH